MITLWFLSYFTENITQPTFDRSIEVAGATESTQKQVCAS